MSLFTKKQRLARDLFCRDHATFTSYEQAFAYGEQRIRLNRQDDWRHIYQCPSCGYWHWGAAEPDKAFYDPRYKLTVR